MYIRDLAAIARLTLVVAGNLPMAAGLKGKTLPGAECQTGHDTDLGVGDRLGCMVNTGDTPQPCVCSVVCDLASADDASIGSAFGHPKSSVLRMSGACAAMYIPSLQDKRRAIHHEKENVQW